jgi:hypothetical protein
VQRFCALTPDRDRAACTAVDDGVGAITRSVGLRLYLAGPARRFRERRVGPMPNGTLSYNENAALNIIRASDKIRLTADELVQDPNPAFDTEEEAAAVLDGLVAKGLLEVTTPTTGPKSYGFPLS